MQPLFFTAALLAATTLLPQTARSTEPATPASAPVSTAVYHADEPVTVQPVNNRYGYWYGPRYGSRYYSYRYPYYNRYPYYGYRSYSYPRYYGYYGYPSYRYGYYGPRYGYGGRGFSFGFRF